MQTLAGRKRVRKFFGKNAEVAEMPNLIEVQKESYDQFLQVQEPEGGRTNEGLQAVFKSVFPISDFSGQAMLEFVRYEFEAPKYDVEECQQRGMTYAAPLKVTLRLIVFEVDQETGAKSTPGSRRPRTGRGCRAGTSPGWSPSIRRLRCSARSG
jgi:DNA-directed RNA polymerase subunit beta